MTRDEVLIVLHEVQRVHRLPVVNGDLMPAENPWPSILALLNATPDLIRLLGEDA